MNTAALKRFATTARRDLRIAIRARVVELGITELGAAQFVQGGILVNAQAFDIAHSDYSALQNHYLEFVNLRGNAKDGLEGLVDELAYTWFNRLTALRYLEANGHHRPTLSGTPDPMALREAYERAASQSYPNLSVTDLQREEAAARLHNRPLEGTVFKWALIGECRALRQSLPLFDGADYLELFVPDTLLIGGSVVRQLLEIADEDWQSVEIIGWLYQFYISDEKDRVMQSKDKYRPQDIPAATQLFTPNWIVQYMVQNSLGRLWLENNPRSTLKSKMPYYLEPQGSDPLEPRNLLEPQGSHLEPRSAALAPQDLTVLDPACGSGHILVYAYDLLHQIYEERGYNPDDIPALILTHNLHGLDIDPRAAQLAVFSVQMKARRHVTRRAFESLPRPQIIAVQSTKNLKLPHVPSSGVNQSDLFGRIAQPVALFGAAESLSDWQPLLDAFQHADSLGSLIAPPAFDAALLTAQINRLQSSGSLDTQLVSGLRALLRQATALQQQFKVVIANPPYMGGAAFDDTLKNFVNTHYPRSKADLFAVFMERCLELTAGHGRMATINQHAWMFLSSYEALRKHVLQTVTIQSMAHLGARAFPEIGGEVVQSTAFVLHKRLPMPLERGEYLRLVDVGDSSLKSAAFLEAVRDPSSGYRFSADARDFAKIPGSPIAYWASAKVLEAFEKGARIAEVVQPSVGLQTSNNDRFMREWHEINIHMTNIIQSSTSQSKKWFTYNKGGEFRKWFGNLENVVNWENNGHEVRNYGVLEYGKSLSRPQGQENYFKSGVTWSAVSSGSFSCRIQPANTIYSNAGMCVFGNFHILNKILTLLNSKLGDYFLAILSPTLNYGAGEIGKIPVLETEKDMSDSVKILGTLSRADWDNFETSWDFQTHPLLRGGQALISDAFADWDAQSQSAFRELQRLEVENNRYWIDAYGLQDELTPDVPDDQITIRRADLGRDVRSLISYAVGCLMGRYSLHAPGLIYAGGAWDATRYGDFMPDSDGILPALDTAYFPDDLTTRLTEFIAAAFGADALSSNLEFIARALKPDAAAPALEVIRAYLLSDFSKDHHRIYKKRPIYWRFTSGKHNAFTALVYLHRINADTLGRIRGSYVIPLLGKLQQELTALDGDVTKKALTRAKKLRDQLLELRDYQERLQHRADTRLELDLDDGVAYNYALLEGLVYDGADLKIDDLKRKSSWKRGA